VVLGLRQELTRGFAIRADAQDGQTNHERTVTYRADSIEGAGIAADYDLTGKLTTSVGCDWIRQDSDISTYTYRRYVASGRLTYRF